MTVEFCGLGPEIEARRAVLDQSYDRGERLAALTALGWYFRQKDSTRARQYLAEAQAILRAGEHGFSTAEVQSETGRLHLATAEMAALAGDMAAALQALDEAEALFRAAGDPAGLGDGCFVAAQIAEDRAERVTERRAAAIDWYRKTRDPVRLALAEILAGNEVPEEGAHPVIRSIAARRRTAVLKTAGDLPGAAIAAAAALASAREIGLLREAALSGLDLSELLNRLGDPGAALERRSDVIDLIRPMGWPQLLARCLVEAAADLGRRRHFEAAAEMIDEAAVLFEKISTDHDVARFETVRSVIDLDRGDAASALTHACRAAEILASSEARCAEARALTVLGRQEEAAVAARAALSAAEADGDKPAQVAALMALASVRRGDPAASGLLDAALALDPAPSDELLLEIASAAARRGDFETAYRHQSRLLDSRRLVDDRGVALQFRLEGLRKSFEAAHERERVRTVDRLHKIMEASPLPISITRIRDGRLVFRNRAWSEKFEVDPDQVEVFAIDHLADQNDSVGIQKALVANKGMLRNFEVRLRTATGRIFWALLNHVVIEYDNDQSILSQSADITELKETQEALRRAQTLAEEASHAKSNFLASMSHEIRTPMNAIVGLAELMSMSALDGEQREMLTLMRESAGGLLGIVDDVLDFSKIEAGKLHLDRVAFVPAEIVSSVVQTLTPAARGRGLDFHHSVTPDMGAVFGDPVRFRQILFNLTGNALKFTERGSVEVVLDGIRQDDGKVRLNLSVRDTGIGIAAENREKLFEPFTQADENTTRRFGGTGLGLSICRRLVEAMGGEIDLVSTMGEGSTFRVTLALEAAWASAGFAETAPRILMPETPQFPGLRILVAEDQAANRNVLRRQFLRLGVAALMVENGVEALAALDADPFDLLITDCHMPEMDGFGLTAAIRAREAGTGGRLPILALTANALQGEAEHCLASGMDGYLTKPATIPQLAAKIAELVQSVRPAAPRQIDLVGLARLAGGDDPEELRAIVADYIETADPALRAAQNALARGAFTAMQSAAHAGKGSAMSVCARSLADYWAELEIAAIGADAAAAARAIAGIGAGMTALKSELREMGETV